MGSSTEVTDRALAHLTATAHRWYGRGWQAEVDRRLGHTRGALGKSIKRGTLRLADFLQVLEVLGIRPSSFFHEMETATGPGDDLPVMARLQSTSRQQISPEVEEIMAGLVFDRETAEADFDSPVLELVTREKDRNAEKALRAAEAALQFLKSGGLSRRLIFPLLFEWASCQRNLDQIDPAFDCYVLAYQRARDLRAARVEAQALLSLPEVVARKSADYHSALELATEAYLSATDLGDGILAARAILIRGRFLYYLGSYERARNNVELALRSLPERESRFIFSGHQYLAQIHKDCRSYPAALYHTARALSITQGVCPQQLGILLWTHASIAADLGDHPKAEESFLRAREILLPVSPVSAALVSIDYARYLVSNDQPATATAITKGLAKLLDPLRRYPIVEATVAELVRLTFQGSTLTIALLSQAAKTIEENSVQPSI